MEILKTHIDGLLLIRPNVHSDARGYFLERYHKARYADVGLACEFVQDNCVYSRYRTIRGLHYQVGDRAQGKLVTVLHGRVRDVAVDIRFGSPTFGEHVAVELSSDNHVQFWIPPGFAHGFSVLSDDALFYYKCTAYYAPRKGRSILFNDPELHIDWQVTDPIVSAKDRNATPFHRIAQDFVFEQDTVVPHQREIR